MSSIFLSHSSADNFEAVALRDWLASEGWDDVFLDLDPERGIAAGERWERALHEAATRCEAVIFLVSAHWLASGWCLKEYNLARALNKKLFAVIVDPCKAIADLPPELKGTWQVVDLAGGQDGQLMRAQLPSSHEEKHVVFSKDGLKRLKRGLDKAGLDPKFFAWPPESDRERAPYRGLKPLEGVDAGIFFGREAPIVEATDRLRGLKTGAPPRLLVILGASGAGKSSFLRAGLLPRLARDERNFLALPVIRPERAALAGENGLLHALDAVLPSRTRAEIRTAIQAGAAGVRPLLEELVTASVKGASAAQDGSKPPTVVLAIDQAEELFRPEGAAEGGALLELVRDLTGGDDPAVITIFAIRSDSYDALEHAKPLEGLAQNALPLLPMPRGAYKDVIEGPALRYSQAGGELTIEPQLTERLLEDIDKGGGSDALPLLAFTLEQLFLDYQSSGALRLTNYENFGGLRGAINAAVERAFARAGSDPHIPADRNARETLLRRGLIPWLAGIDPDSKTPRRNISRRSEIPAEAEPLIALLVEERLLSTDVRLERDPSGAEIRVATIEPAHEALLRQWGLLQGWLEEDFALLATLEGVARAARDWDANGRAEAWLAHQGQRLADAYALDARADIAGKLDWTDREYLLACQDKEDTRRAEAEARRRERDEEQTRRILDARRLTRRTLVGLVAALILTLVAVGFGLFARREASLAEENSKEAAAQRESAEAGYLATELRAREAKQNLTAALAALSRARLSASPADAVKLALAGWPRSAEDKTTPKADVNLTALSDAVTDLRERRILGGHADSVSAVAFTSNGSRVVTASDAVRVWDVETGKLINSLSEGKCVFDSTEKVNCAISPDGSLIADLSNGVTQIWNTETGKLVSTLNHGGTDIQSAEFSADGSRIMIVFPQGIFPTVWNTSTGKEIEALEIEKVSLEWAGIAGVSYATLSPDGSQVVASVYYRYGFPSDDSPRLWNTRTGKVTTLHVNKGELHHAAFSADGSRIIIISTDKTAWLGYATTGKQIAVLSGHEGNVASATFSPDGTRVVTASDDKTARLWDAATGRPIAVLRGHEGAVNSAAFSADGTRVVTASADNTARLWDAMTGTLIAVLRGHEGAVSSAMFSPDGSRIATTSADNTARLWDAATDLPITLLRLQEYGSGVEGGLLSHDGSRIITWSDDNTARVWDKATGKSVAILHGHKGIIDCAALSPDDSRIVTGSLDDTARLWDTKTGKLLAVLGESKGDGPFNGYKDVWVVTRVAFSPDGARILTSSDDARLWDAATGKSIAVLSGDHALYSPDGSRVVTMSGDTPGLWDAATGKPIADLLGHEDNVISTAFSPDGNRIVTTSDDKTARLWDTATGKLTVILRGHEDKVYGAAYSADGSQVVTASADKTARVWEAATGKPIAVLRGHEDAVVSASFSPDGTRIVTVSGNTVRVWDKATGRPIAVLRGLDEAGNSAAFSSDGSRINARSEHVLGTWDASGIPKGDLFHIACAWLPDHDLTDVARDYGLANLDRICEGDPPLPDSVDK
jgi:WD40 repeat protein